MSSEKTDAIVTRLADWSNTSRVVTYFTRDFGRISAVAKGGKRLKGPFDSALDLLSTSRIVFLRKSSSALDILTEASLINRFRPDSANINGFYAGCYLAELLNGLTEDYDPHPSLFEASCQTLDRFSTATDYRLPLLWFELTILREIGQLPAFDSCVLCAEPIQIQDDYSFWVTQGGLLCSSCRNLGNTHHQIQAGTVAILTHLASGDETAITRLTASEQQYREMRHTITTIVSAIMGRRPKTLKYLYF